MTTKTHLTLSAEERDALLEALQSLLADLRYEISDTDSHDFKEGLKTRKHLLESVAEQLQKG